MSEYCRDDFGLVEQADDDFKMWQGLVGPHYTPSVSEDGTLSWSNNGQLPNPEDVSIKGPPGEPGPPGAPGPGVPAGGTTGQILAKASDEDYDGEWIDPPEIDAGQVSYDSTETYSDGTVGKELGTINSALSSLSSVTEIIDTASGAIASFPDGAGLPMRSLLAQINPVQDLHGYDAPWAAGAGKNKLPTILADIKTSNTTGTWSGNKYTLNGIEFSVNTDVDGNVTDITANGTASANADIYIIGTGTSGYVSAGITSGSYVFSGNPTSNSTATMFIVRSGGTIDCNVYDTNEKPVTIDDTTTYRIFIRINSGKQVSNAKFQPMVRLSTVSDATFAPYSNICPITGWTGLSGKRCGKNLYDSTTYPLTNGKWISGEKGTLADNNDMSATVNYIPCGHLAGQTITLNKRPSGYKSGIAFYSEALEASFLSGIQNNGATAGNPWTIDVPSNAKYMRFTTIANAAEVQIETGSTASTYEAYTSLPITVSWQDEAGTVYDGYIDVVSGELVATHGIADLSTLTWSATSWGGWRGNVVSDMKLFSPDENANLVAEKYKSASRTSMQSVPSSISAGLSNDPKRLFVNATDSPTGMCVYPLAEPIVYQLSPQQISTLLGNNTVFVDTGSVSVTYQASIKGYIDKVLGA